MVCIQGKPNTERSVARWLRGPEDTFYRGEAVPELPYSGPCIALHLPQEDTIFSTSCKYNYS